MQNRDFGLIVRDIAEKQGISQVDLALRSKVSRVQINRIFRGGAESVRPETQEKIATALGLDLAKLSGLDVLQRYRHKMRDKHLVKSLAGLGFAEFQRQPLNTFYVPPAGVDKSKSKHPREGDALDCVNETQQKEEPLPAVDYIKANKRVIVLGVPGSGKTTLVQFLATEVATGGLDAMNLPIVVRLPEFALALSEQPDLTILDWVVSQAEAMECMDIVDPLLRQLHQEPGSVLALFDGLDEVPGFDAAEPNRSSLRARLIDAVKEFIREFRNQRFVITSRISGFDETQWTDLDFRKFELKEYGDDQIRQAISKWSTILANSKHESANKIEQDLSESIFENPRVKQLSGNPLILTILIVMCKSRGYALPRRRVDLYEKVTEVFLDSWEKSKRKEHGFRETGNIDLDTRELRWLIAELALAMQNAGLFTAHRWWVIDHLQNTLCNRLGFDDLTAKKQADPILRFVSARAGLLDERLPSVFAFSHRTMQEYFAAIGIIEESSVDPARAGLAQIVRPHVFHPEWSEVVRLVAAQVSPSPAEDLLKLIVDDADPTGRFLQRGELLAVKCLADGATVSDRRFVQSIFDTLQEHGNSVWLGVTMETFASLDLLLGTRYEQVAVETKDAILAKAKVELSDRQYRMLVFSAYGPRSIKLEFADDESNSPVLKRKIAAGEFEESHYFPNLPLFSNNFDQWQKHAGTWLRSQDIDDDAKESIIDQLSFAPFFDRDANHLDTILALLTEVLHSRSSATVRSAAAKTIGAIDRDKQVNKQGLLSCLENSNEPLELRAACAIALEHSAVHDAAIRQKLTNILWDEKESERLRKSAAYGLEEAAAESDDVANLLLTRAITEIPDSLAVACVFALTSVAHKYTAQFCRWIDEESNRSFAAARVMAELTLSGSIPWDNEIICKVERILCSAGSEPFESFKPCFHVLIAIKGLVDERERRGGLRREAVISDLLRPLAKKIVFAFVYGSVARNDQDNESDIDLMLIGTISQKEITQAIRKMKSVLGREVNPTVYSTQTFSRKYRDGDPFFVEVVDNPKIFVLTDDAFATEKEFLNELGRLEAQQLA